MENQSFLKYLLEQLKKFFEGHREALKLIEGLEELGKNSTERSKTSPLKIKEIPEGKERLLEIYTDGACSGNPGRGAWAAVAILIYKDPHGIDPEGPNIKEEILFEKVGVELQTTNNRMELQGVIEGLKEIKSLSSVNLVDTVIRLYSDSQYVVNGLKSWMINWKERGWKKKGQEAPLNLDLWQEADNVLSDFPAIEFLWVKGHSGNYYNERCDQLATSALVDLGK